MSSSASAAFNAGKGGAPKEILATYGVFAAGAWTVHHYVANGEFSAILTMSVVVQCLALALLAVQSLASGSSAGISARALAIESCSIVCRLSSTLWLNGYLPMDSSGDGAYQAFDVVSLVIALWLLRRTLVTHRASYQAQDDAFPCAAVVVACLAMAALFHGNMNRRPLFDSLWLAGLLLSIAAVLPQLWVVAKCEALEALTSHYIAAMAAARMLSGTFMWFARHDITSDPARDGISYCSIVILCAHAVHLLLLADFAYCYMRSVVRKGLCSLEKVDFCCTFV